MTIAVCIRCGEQKVGAWTLCSNCGFEPVEPVDKAKSLFLSDHHLDENGLNAAIDKLENEQEPSYDHETIATIATNIKLQSDEIAKIGSGCRTLGIVAILILLALAIIIPFAIAYLLVG